MTQKKMSRMESSKEVRRVLNRNGVDLSFCQYSCSGKEIRLTGALYHYDGSDFSAQQIDGMIQEFMSILPGFMIVGELDNWSFSSDHISYQGSNELEEEEEEEEQSEVA